MIRPSKDLPEIHLLGNLVDYLENVFQLPANLPMIYENLPGNEETRCLLAWDSPLSPSPEATRLEVEVVAIYTDNKKGEVQTPSSSKPTVPNMAMVVVRKAKASVSTLPPMMKNLFQDSEKRILKSLDRGLEDLLSGKVKLASNDRKPKVPKNVKTAEEALEVELMNEIPEPRKPKIEAQDVVYDAYATVDDYTTSSSSNEKKQGKASPENVAAAKATMKIKADQSETTHDKTSGVTDYAVEAAQQKAKARKIPKPLEDYAVAAARRIQQRKAETKAKPAEDYSVAAARKVAASRSQSKASQAKAKPAPTANAEALVEGSPVALDQNFKIPDYMGNDRAFRTTLSRPRDRAKARNNGKNSPAGSSSKAHEGIARTKNDSPSKTASENIAQLDPKSGIETAEKTNIKRLAKGGDQRATIQSNAKQNTRVDKKPMPSREQIEMDIMKAAQNVMNEIAEQGHDMTPEELLQDVLKFGEEKEKEDAVGSGFATAAFDKAKELMREQYRQSQAKQGYDLGYKELDPTSGIGIQFASDEDNKLSAEEELRRMFEAGERIAESRITQSEYSKAELVSRQTTEEDVDALIARDKSISKYARSLDEELTELELTINASPGEELDGPRQNPLFDIMSGPEVYNPNVELDSVNYPGAMPGAKSVQLPKALNEAVQQAQFAVEVLADLKTVESVDEEGIKEVKFFAGDRELSEEQVSRLEVVAKEAIEIGLIKNPIKLLEESSRLQMILDELWGQPDERFREVAENYKDLLLSDNFVDLIKARLVKMAERDVDALRRNDESLKEAHERERKILGRLVAYAQLLLKETRALGAELEAQQLEVIRSICQVAMDPKHQTEEEAAMALSDAVRDMRPLLDDSFVAYLKYAVAEEEARLARSGIVDDPEYNRWLLVLKIVQQGVYAEIAKGINRYIEHIWYVLRMETPRQRRLLLSELIDAMPTMDVRPFVQVVNKIVGCLGDSARGEFEGAVELGEMTNKLLQLHRDVKELLPPARIAEMSRDADEWAAKQRKRLLEARKLGKQRLKAANDVADRQDEIEAIGRRGEVDRFE